MSTGRGNDEEQPVGRGQCNDRGGGRGQWNEPGRRRPGMRSIHLYKWCLYYRWMERIPGGTRENDGLETCGYGCGREMSMGKFGVSRGGEGRSRAKAV